MRLGEKYLKDIWFCFFFFFPALTVGGKWRVEGRLYNLPHSHPKITFLAWVPICTLHTLVRHIRLLTGFGQKTMLHGVVCALAPHHTLTAPHFFSGLWQADLTLSPSLTPQHCQIHHIHAYLKAEWKPLLPHHPSPFKGLFHRRHWCRHHFIWRC